MDDLQQAFLAGFEMGFDGAKAKAKTIIRDLLSCLYSVEYDRITDLEEAERFVQEEV